jgi:hypothetical protein
MWKPKWFRPHKKSMVAFLAMGLGISLPFTEASAQDRLRGGSGGFMIGFKTFNSSAYQFFIPEGGPVLGDHLIQIGGEGYGLYNRWVIGGGGYYHGGDRQEDGNLAYEIHGGGGYFNLGYVLYYNEQFLVFPLLGLGADAVGINRRIEEDIAFDPDRFLEANYFTVTPTLDVGAGVDWFPGKKGLKLGLRAGYNFSLARGNDWRHYGGEITNPDLPNNDLDGLYVRLTVGGGHFLVQ